MKSHTQLTYNNATRTVYSATADDGLFTIFKSIGRRMQIRPPFRAMMKTYHFYCFRMICDFSQGARTAA